MMKNSILVLGANGHLGNNLLRELLAGDNRVKAGVRNLNQEKVFDGIDCEIVHADLLDKASLVAAMEGIDILFVVAGVYKSWARDIKKEIIDVNIGGTRNVMEAATAQKVKKIIYVSTVFTLDNTRIPMNASGWKKGKTDAYTYSKIEAERLAWELAQQHNLNMVSVLPSGMIGPHSYGHLTPTMEALYSMLNNKIPIDPCFGFNLVDVRDVARAMVMAAEKGIPGTRYILAQADPIRSTDVFHLARSYSSSVKIPRKAGYMQLFAMASIAELVGKLTGKKPLMHRLQVKQMYKANQCYDITKAVTDLGFNPRSSKQAVMETFQYLSNRDVN